VHHRIVRCASGATATSHQQSFAENNKCATVRACTRRSQSRRQKAHRTVYRTCLVHHRTVRWPQLSELQWSEPNGLVTWLAAPPRCGGPKPQNPQPPHFNVSKFSAFKPHTKAITFNTRHNQRDQILSQVRNHSKQISD
jgi:hypothetical protein